MNASNYLKLAVAVILTIYFASIAYNPMAGPHALETTEQLLAVDAEAVAMEAAREAVDVCGYSGAITLAVVLCSPGAWTNRLATEIEHRAAHRLATGHGLVLHWSRETPTAEQIRREAIGRERNRASVG